MNRSGRRVSYRRRAYRKNRIKLILGVIAAVLVTVFIALVIAGNVIGDKVEDNVTKRTGKVTQTEALPHGEVKKVLAYPVPIYVEGSSLLATRIKNASDEGYTDACFFLDGADGSLTYNSDVAISLGKHASQADMPTLKKAMEAFHDKSMHTVGMTYLSEFNTDDDLTRSAAIGYYSALISEALRSGVDDVLIYVGEIPVERYAELSELARDVHRLCPDGKIGLSLPTSVLSDQENSELIDGLWDYFDYLAADLTTIEAGEEQTLSDAMDTSLGGMLYFLLRYDMRVLVPHASDPTQMAQILETVKQNGSENIQIIQQ
ncbi:MAG: hypothetical protein E7677_01595 [Ruminococcaceae bacterium]|nr:hypothetical protein [Oscillospiraceae bacterium]